VKEMAKEVQTSRSGEAKQTAEDLDEFMNKVFFFFLCPPPSKRKTSTLCATLAWQTNVCCHSAFQTG
jgi:hypothetical protein